MVRGYLIALLVAVLPAAAVAASLDAETGRRLFQRNWVPAPSSTTADDGLGPLYDAQSCSSCHMTNTGVTFAGKVIRLGNADGGGDPTYGHQLQTGAIGNLAPEGVADLQWTVKDNLRVAVLAINRLGYGALAQTTKLALRRAPNVFGVGLLADVPDSEILSREDPDDTNGDGVRGRAARLANGRIGRFGWKATQPTLAAQVDMAFYNDMGLSTAGNPAPWGDCTEHEMVCRDAPHGAKPGDTEIVAEQIDLIMAYLKSLPAPGAAPDARGAALFAQTGCTACHAALRTAFGEPVPAFTDLLLHDMGPGLNDGIREGAAAPGFWRTAPLWGLRQTLASGLLHDGRARGVEDAIEWHEGEAAGAHAHFDALTVADKTALIAYVNGL